MADEVVVGRLLGVLRATPVTLDATAREVPAERLRLPPAPGEWSAVEVLAHLRACADVWGGCIERVLNEERPVIRAVNPRSYVRRTDYPGLAFAASLAAFAAQRAGLLTVLDALPPGAWDRSAEVRGAGRPLTTTVFSYVERLARHERPHVAQIARAVGHGARPGTSVTPR